MRIRIWLMAFAEFAAKSGTSRVVSVETTKKRAAMRLTRGSMFYLGIKEACQAADMLNARRITARAVQEAFEERQGHYAKIAEAFCQWIEGRQSYQPLPMVTGLWEYDGMAVGVSPELHAEVDGQEYLIKLHFPGRAIAKEEVLVCNTLMREALGAKVGSGCKMAVLDVRAKKLHVERPKNHVRSLLAVKADAAAFASIWRELPDVQPEVGAVA